MNLCFSFFQKICTCALYSASLLPCLPAYSFSFHICVCVSHLVVSESLQPHGMGPTRLLCQWNSPGKNTGVGYHFFPGDLPNPGIEPGSRTMQADSLSFLFIWVSYFINQFIELFKQLHFLE